MDHLPSNGSEARFASKREDEDVCRTSSSASAMQQRQAPHNGTKENMAWFGRRTGKSVFSTQFWSDLRGRDYEEFSMRWVFPCCFGASPWYWKSNQGKLLDNFEPKDINFRDLCKENYPGKRWQDIPLEDQTRLIAKALRPEHFLLDPHSASMKYWDLLVVIALAFTGLITPYEVVFTKELNIGLFAVNRVFDLVFVVDMVLQLFLKVEIKQEGKYGTIVVRDPKALRRRYLRGWFVVDLVSILPFDIITLLLETPSDSLQQMKIFRLLRIMRLVKLLRILRTSRIVLRWQNFLAIKFATQKFLKFIVVLILVSHWMACLWGAVGLFLGQELCPDPRAGATMRAEDIPVEEVSWITTHFTDNKRSPDSPCNHFHIYLAALHWSVMTITSIGYGDIYPVRDVEYVVGIGCMLLGGVLWAYIIGCTCSILSNMHPVEENFETNTDLLNTIMKEVAMPQGRKGIYREYLREAKVHNAMSMFHQVTKSFSPLLRKELMLHINETGIRRVYYFKNAPRAFVMELSEKLFTRFFARREPLSDIRHCLCMIERGTLAHGGRILVPGNAFQEDMIVSNLALQAVQTTVSLTYTLILVLQRKDLDRVLCSWPAFEREIRKSAARLALRRVVMLCAEFEREKDWFGQEAAADEEAVDCAAEPLRAICEVAADEEAVDRTAKPRRSLVATFMSLEKGSQVRKVDPGQKPRTRGRSVVPKGVQFTDPNKDFHASGHYRHHGQELSRGNTALFSQDDNENMRSRAQSVFIKPVDPQPLQDAFEDLRSDAFENMRGKYHSCYGKPDDLQEEHLEPSAARRIEAKLDALALELKKLKVELRSGGDYSL